MSMDIFIYGTFSCLALFAILLQYFNSKSKSEASSGNNPQFKTFQYTFFVVYFLALFSDWLQGPYVYKLYAHYGFASSQIALLYVVGFASSGIFGTLTGPIADRFGRKKMALVFCFLYTFCCLTKLSANFYWLFIGRVLGGISTSLLFSTFESWYVYEHTEKYDFPKEWLSVTFSKSTFWNGILAINAGVVANVFAETMHFGPVAPFIISIPFLSIAAILILKLWPENYGNQSFNVQTSCMEGLRTILSNNSILYLGIAQSLFESNMYIFVFQWTPILDKGHPPLGMIFACFMVCIMIGSCLYSILLSKNFRSEVVLMFSVIISISSMSVCIFSTIKFNEAPYVSFMAFLALEIAVGMYFPSIGYLRSQVIPENMRAGIMNWFRLPTNFLTCCALLLLHNNTLISSTQSMFSMCTIMLMVAFTAVYRFNKVYSKLEIPLTMEEPLLETDTK